MAERSFVWAIDEEGNPTKCYAKPENRGIGTCKHIFHQKEGESQKDFFHRASNKEGLDRRSVAKMSIPFRPDQEEITYVNNSKQIFEDESEDLYIHMPQPVWNDMDKQTFSGMTGISVKKINEILSEKDGLKKLNELAAENDFTATQDVYVLPLKYRMGTDDIPNPLTSAYKRLYTTKKYSSCQASYEALISESKSVKGTNITHTKTLADEFGGKNGIFRKAVTGCTIPYSGRAVAVPDASLDYDEISIPQTMAVEIFRPTVYDGLKERGFSSSQVREVIDSVRDNEPTFRPLIEDVLREKNVRALYNRQPSLHEASLLGMKVRLNGTNSVASNPIIAPGMNLDHDGDTVQVIGINSAEIAEKVDRELNPSKYKFAPGNKKNLIMQPTKDSLFGIANILKNRS